MTPGLLSAASFPTGAAAAVRTVLVVSPDAEVRRRLAQSLAALRWQVTEVAGGAEAMLRLEAEEREAMLVDGWLPDLEVGEFVDHAQLLYPAMEVLLLDGTGRRQGTALSLRRNELLHALRDAGNASAADDAASLRTAEAFRFAPDGKLLDGSRTPRRPSRVEVTTPELVGASLAMREMISLIRMVAPRSTTVLIEGETGTGKELVARALHRLSLRAAQPFAVLNCAAIPESLLEAELFGHTRGAFTGAVQARMGRIETANGGTLLLDEIGEMPLPMQAKMLRFLESGELQRVGDNQITQVDVRLIAATHQPLEQRSTEGTFRLDLYHRLAVFPIEVPPLRERLEDVAALAEHFLGQMGRESPRKRLTEQALAKLQTHTWPGNVRELMHVLERGAILAGLSPEIAAEDIRYRRSSRG